MWPWGLNATPPTNSDALVAVLVRAIAFSKGRDLAMLVMPGTAPLYIGATAIAVATWEERATSRLSLFTRSMFEAVAACATECLLRRATRGRADKTVPT